MFTSRPATGLQIAVLILLIDFLIAIAAKYLAIAIGWPQEYFSLLGNILEFTVAAAVVFGIPSLRRYVLDTLATPLSRAFRSELLLVAALKPAIPFGLMGAAAIYYVAWAPPPDLFRTLGLATDPAAVTRKLLTPYGLVHATLIALIVGPFFEEIVYRGILYRAWERQWGWFPAMLATSALFGALHPSHMVSAFLGSVVYVCLLRRAGSLWAPIFAHSIYNLLVAWPLLGHVLFVRPRETVGSLETWALEIACLVVASIGLAGYVWLARRPHGAIPETVVLATSYR